MPEGINSYEAYKEIVVADIRKEHRSIFLIKGAGCPISFIWKEAAGRKIIPAKSIRIILKIELSIWLSREKERMRSGMAP